MIMKNHGWDSSTRKSRLPYNWNSLRKRVLIRDRNTCRLKMSGCITKATEVDHIIPGDNHSTDNLQAVCTECHKLKSSREGNTAQARKRGLKKRPIESHPGLRKPGS